MGASGEVYFLRNWMEPSMSQVTSDTPYNLLLPCTTRSCWDKLNTKIYLHLVVGDVSREMMIPVDVIDDE
jgi:hypothetical protein